jgi:plastocyanin
MRLMACLLAVAALAVAGCGSSNKSSGNNKSSSSSGGSSSNSGGSSNSSSSSSSSSSGGGGKVAVAADPGGALKFTTKTLKAKSGTVTFNFDNPASIPHALAIEGHGVDKSSKVVTKGKSALTLNLKPGKYTFYCPVDGHKAAGMEGTLIVS